MSIFAHEGWAAPNLPPHNDTYTQALSRWNRSLPFLRLVSASMRNSGGPQDYTMMALYPHHMDFAALDAGDAQSKTDGVIDSIRENWRKLGIFKAEFPDESDTMAKLLAHEASERVPFAAVRGLLPTPNTLGDPRYHSARQVAYLMNRIAAHDSARPLVYTELALGCIEFQYVPEGAGEMASRAWGLLGMFGVADPVSGYYIRRPLPLQAPDLGDYKIDTSTIRPLIMPRPELPIQSSPVEGEDGTPEPFL